MVTDLRIFYHPHANLRHYSFDLKNSYSPVIEEGYKVSRCDQMQRKGKCWNNGRKLFLLRLRGLTSRYIIQETGTIDQRSSKTTCSRSIKFSMTIQVGFLKIQGTK